jgi:thioredoxin 1
MIEVNADNFDAEVRQSNLPVVVDLWGPKCVPCLALMPNVVTMGDEFEGRVKFCKLNVMENRRLVISLKVMGVPTFLFFKDGEQQDRITGDEVTVDAIRNRAQKLLG